MTDHLGWWATVRADHRALQGSRDRYDDRFEAPDIETSTGAVVRDLATNVGFQQMAVFRLSQVLARRRLTTPLAMLVSRTIRHLYAAEMHWEAAIEPGVVIVHGNGLVVSRAAAVGPNCILSQHATLGISVGADGQPAGAPRLGPNVFVGPGAALIGPIEVGANSKIAPNAVVMNDVPPESVVRPADTVVQPRPGRAATAG